MITQNIIGYELSAVSGKQIFAVDAATLQNLPEEFTPATLEEVDRAMQKAKTAWRIFRKTDTEQRAQFLSTIADGIESISDTLVPRMMHETAYPESRVLVELRRTVAQLRMFADYIMADEWRGIVHDPALPDRKPTPRPDLRKMNIAIGPVVVFAASNFPLAYSTIGGDAASAFAAGCPVIVKAHESHLGTNALVAEVIMNAARVTGMPDGVFSSLIGDGYETGKALVEHEHTAAVGFTGSLAGGRALFDIANKRKNPIPVFAEMGSVNPVFLLPGRVEEDLEYLPKKLADSMSLTVGQFCTNPGVIVALRNDLTDNLISATAQQLSLVNGATMLNQNILQNYQKGLDVVTNNEKVKIITTSAQEDPLKVKPVLATVDATDFIQDPSLHHELFGPYSIVVVCNSFDEMMMVANTIEGQLTATIHASENDFQDVSQLTEVLQEKAGRIICNGVPTGVEVCEAMTHGGPYPASTDSRFTAVGHHGIKRWLRPVTFQDFPTELLPDDLR